MSREKRDKEMENETPLSEKLSGTNTRHQCLFVEELADNVLNGQLIVKKILRTVYGHVSVLHLIVSGTTKHSIV